MTTPRLAVFDFGSNSLKFSLFGRDENARIHLLGQTREFTAVGDDVFSTGMISEEKAAEVEAAIGRLKQRLADGDAIAAAATSAFREAANGAAMLQRFSTSLGATIQLLDGLEEAALIAEGVLGELDGQPAAVLDIGGGSVELIRSASRTDIEVISLDLGAIRLREQFCCPADNQLPPPEALEQMDRFVCINLEALVPLDARMRLFGSGGGFTTLGDMLFGQDNRSGLILHLDQLRQAAQMIQKSSAEELSRHYDLPLRRARIMAAGSMVAVRTMQCLEAKEITVSWAGLREGLAWRWVRQAEPTL